MLDGHPLIDAHTHPARLPTIKPTLRQWAHDTAIPEGVYDADGTVVPGRFDAYLAGQGVDVALVLAEYSPKVTGIQPVEDLLPLAACNPDRIKIVANVNPHLHYPIDEELERQLGLGAVALKVHPVHAGAPANDRALYPAYEMCQSAGIPVVVHCGTSTFPGAANTFADPVLLDDVLRDFRRLTVVLAHGGRGWWYDAAAFMALSSERVWIELSGLPPSRLREYYARQNWARLTRRMIFATDWPGVPGIERNARAVAALCPDDDTAALVLSGNASRVYNLGMTRGDGPPDPPQRPAAVLRRHTGHPPGTRPGSLGRLVASPSHASGPGGAEDHAAAGGLAEELSVFAGQAGLGQGRAGTQVVDRSFTHQPPGGRGDRPEKPDRQVQRRVVHAGRQHGVHGTSARGVQQRRVDAAVHRADRVVLVLGGRQLEHGPARAEGHRVEAERVHDRRRGQPARQDLAEERYAVQVTCCRRRYRGIPPPVDALPAVPRRAVAGRGRAGWTGRAGLAGGAGRALGTGRLTGVARSG